jgi:hypothetical protein
LNFGFVSKEGSFLSKVGGFKMDVADDFKPEVPYSGVVETFTDCGPFGSKVPTILRWFLDYSETVRIEFAELEIKHFNGEKNVERIHLTDWFRPCPQALGVGLRLNEWLEECTDDYHKKVKHYYDMGGKQPLRCV